MADCKHHWLLAKPRLWCNVIRGGCTECHAQGTWLKDLEHSYGRVPRGVWGMWKELEVRGG